MMNMLGDKKKVAGLVLAMHMGKKPEGEEEEHKSSSKEDVDHSELGDLHVAAEEILEAIRNNKATELTAAMLAFHHLVDAKQYEEDAEEEKEAASE